MEEGEVYITIRDILAIIFLIALILVATIVAHAQAWSMLTFDPQGDGDEPGLADAATLCYRYDKQQDYLWFRLGLYGAPNEQAFGVNIAVDSGAADAPKMNWWGSNKDFKFDKLITAWVTRGGQGYQGTIGVADANGAGSKQFTNLSRNNLQIRVETNAIVIGIKRADLTDRMKLSVVAAAGSNQNWNDDIPNTASAPFDLAAERPKQGLRELDFARNNIEHAAGYKTLRDTDPPRIDKSGRGTRPMILIPGMYSGARSFDGFMARNRSRYRFYVVTPPGINGTRARTMPPAGTSFGELNWTRRLTRDVLQLIRRENLRKPIILVERQPGSVVAMELALQHPDEVGGVVLVGTNLSQFMASPKDPARKTPATLPERVGLVDRNWAAQWFKFVTPETWLSNDMRPEMLARDPAMGQRASNEIEAASLEVKIRYLCEFWASDVTVELGQLKIPVLTLIPGFDEKFLIDPANAFAQISYVDPWNTTDQQIQKIQRVMVPNARLLLLDEQPAVADKAVAEFVNKLQIP
jgi:pimeloyl-ACP methyl ester carboxylesterase